MCARVSACELLFVCFFEPHVLQLWPFPWLHVKPVNKARSHGKRVQRAAEEGARFCEEAHHWLDLRKADGSLLLAHINKIKLLGQRRVSLDWNQHQSWASPHFR